MASIATEWSDDLIVIDTSAQRFGSGVDIWQIGEVPDPLGPPCWAVMAARYLLSLPYEEAVPRLLEFVGEAAGADRAWMLRFNDEVSLLRNSNEWCREGVSSHVADLQNVPVTILGEMLAPLREGRSIAVNDVSLLPRSLRSMQVEFRHQQIQSTLTVPVRNDDGRLIACIGLDSTRAERRWTVDEVHALIQIAALMGVANTEGAPSRRPVGEDFSVPVYLRSGRTIRGVPLASIAAIRADRDGAIVCLRDGVTLDDDRPLRWWQSVLPEQDFLRVHRSALINVRLVEMLRRRQGGQDLELLVTGLPESTPVSRASAAELRRRLGA
ncbi:GAF domain-containing protein [Alteraurantiacibacter aquimixticola]|uniref:GAF domain-containing protein n=1 Tax=Alteraurantiacibacter aquimixticola TaxID=2489173 RepID=A0A4T3F531_9SPHN|nr:GAF domain-containing protein [Alteraurantiacibacter aquimixticola]TIX51484.1 GAF domain-containing protein [Alteraurantiacibacter aquimixticola]